MDLVIRKTVMKLFSTPGISKNILFLIKSIKTTKHQVQLLAFYSKCLGQSKNKLLFEIVNQLQLE